MELNTKMQSERYTKLDGLRGLLSLVVALNHSYLIVAIPAFANVWNQNYLQYVDLQSKLQQIFMILGNGGVAVTLFFILSGLVLGQSLSRVEFNFKGLLAFMAKRMLRLYPAYAFVIVLSAIYMKLGYRHMVFESAASWFNWWMNFEMTLTEFTRNLLFLSTSLGGVMWTLRVIVIASIVFPLFYLLYRKTNALTNLCITLLLVWFSFTVLNLPGFRDLRYWYMFYAGLMLPRFENMFRNIPGRLIAVLSFPLIFLMMIARYQSDEYQGAVVESLIGWFLIGILVYNSTTIFDVLNKKIMLFFGKISYSLYLIHFSILYIIARAMFLYVPNFPYEQYYFFYHTGIFVVSLAVATGVSVLVHKYIEEPSQLFSKSVGQRILKK